MAATYYGVVDEDGSVKMAGSGNWSSEVRDDTPGLYKVTLKGGGSAPIPTVTLASNDLNNFGSGLSGFINITDSGTDENGHLYFGVAVNNTSGNLTATGFSFLADN